MPQMVGGVRYEHGHRMVAEFVGLLTIILAVWIWRVDKRRWLRLLGLAALATVIAQGVLGGLTVLFLLPPFISSAHAAVAQTFFCIAVSIVLFTGRRWVEEQPRAELDQRRPALFTLTLLSICVLYVQLLLGAMFRHHGLSWWPHVINAGVVAIVLSWTAVRAISVYPEVDAVRRPAIAMLGLMVAQLCLGFLAFITRVMWGRDAAQPELPMVIATVVHVAVGALLLATTVVLAIQVWRHVPVAFEERVPGHDQNPVAA
jgi:heme a synthase